MFFLILGDNGLGIQGRKEPVFDSYRPSDTVLGLGPGFPPYAPMSFSSVYSSFLVTAAASLVQASLDSHVILTLSLQTDLTSSLLPA